MKATPIKICAILLLAHGVFLATLNLKHWFNADLPTAEQLVDRLLTILWIMGLYGFLPWRLLHGDPRALGAGAVVGFQGALAVTRWVLVYDGASVGFGLLAVAASGGIDAVVFILVLASPSMGATKRLTTGA